MMQLKRVFLVFFLFFTAVFPAASQEAEAGEELPIKATFENSSRFQVQVHILSYGTIAVSYTLEPRQNMEIDVQYGHAVLLEYPAPPHRTELSQMGSLNELYRGVYLRNDGDNLFVEEKFSGQRVKGKGQRRAIRATISEPGMEGPRNREQDNVQPGNKKKQIDIDNYRQQQKNKNKKNKKTRKEDPTQPENKTEKKEPHGMGDLYAAHPMAWGTYMLRKSFVSVFIRIRVKARENPFRFEMMYRTRENPTTVNRVQQPAAHERE